MKSGGGLAARPAETFSFRDFYNGVKRISLNGRAMKLPCEIMAKYTLPVFRAMLARRLVEEYGFAQTKVASILGVSQASVNHYLTAKRGRKSLPKVWLEELQKLADEMAEGVVEGRIGEEDIPRRLCKLCTHLRKSVGTPF